MIQRGFVCRNIQYCFGYTNLMSCYSVVVVGLHFRLAQTFATKYLITRNFIASSPVIKLLCKS